ncbi:ATP-binding protein [Pseudonocardiaceae bacterium YIM PH 21723]|nr:ATP-binding protein [Pseudonocardiaceae bacterium YIM PH 21723]
MSSESIAVDSNLTLVTLGRRGLLVVGGLPGAGKSTLIGGLPDTQGITVLDSDQVRTRLRAALPGRLPYPVYRPVVHATHWFRILRHALRAKGPVVVHEPATRGLTRVAFRVMAALTGREPHLLWVDSAPEEALRGQRQRGRVVRSRSFQRHVRRAQPIRCALLGGTPLPGWLSCRLVSRGEARHGMRLAVTG